MNQHTVELDTFVSTRSALAAFDFELTPERPPHGFPLVAVCMFGTSLAVFAFWLHFGMEQEILQYLGSTLLGLSVLAFVYYRAVTRAKIGTLMQRFSPALDELKQLSSELKAYLKKLDERTSRYFHAVTNTKVTTYFMLRQIDAEIDALSDEIEFLMSSSTAKNYQKIIAILKGSIEFRDGLERNSGQVHEIAVVHLTAHVQALAHQLEAGVSELEADIERYNKIAKRGEPFPEVSEMADRRDPAKRHNLLDPKQ